MRIDGDKRLSKLQVYGTGPGKQDESQAARKRSASESDEVIISNKSRELHKAMQAVAATPEVRHDVVNAIKSRLESNTYTVSGKDVVRKIMPGKESS